MRLIDADKLNEEFQNHYEVRNPKQNATMDEVCMMLFHAPTVDAVHVVRCRDCKHFNMQEMECENDAISTDHEGGASYSLNFYLDDFCSYGERKEGAD